MGRAIEMACEGRLCRAPDPHIDLSGRDVMRKLMILRVGPVIGFAG